MSVRGRLNDRYLQIIARLSSSDSSLSINEPNGVSVTSFKVVRTICTVVSRYPAGLPNRDLMYELVGLSQRAAENKNGMLVFFPVTLLRTFGSLMLTRPLDADDRTFWTSSTSFAIMETARSIWKKWAWLSHYRLNSPLQQKEQEAVTSCLLQVRACRMREPAHNRWWHWGVLCQITAVQRVSGMQ